MPTDERTDLAELILYAVPSGELMETCRRYWSRLAEVGRSTVAQTYPPHCTLTGFFHRPPERIDDVLVDVARAVPDRVVPAGEVSATLTVTDDWVGFALDAPRFLDAVAAFVGTHDVHPGEDVLRPKSWLHLSLAYGDGLDIDWHAATARDLFTDETTDRWAIGLWRRHGRWDDLGPAVTPR